MSDDSDPFTILFDHKQSSQPTYDSRGWCVLRWNAFVGGTPVGRISASYIPKQAFKILYPSVLFYASMVRGESVLPRRTASETSQFMDMRFTAEEIDEATRKINSTYGDPRRYKKAFEAFERYHCERPQEDYVEVYKDFRRKGYGTRMYLHLTRWFSERGLNFYASGVQSEYAKAVWRSFHERLPEGYSTGAEPSGRQFLYYGSERKLSPRKDVSILL